MFDYVSWYSLGGGREKKDKINVCSTQTHQKLFSPSRRLVGLGSEPFSFSADLNVSDRGNEKNKDENIV